MADVEGLRNAKRFAEDVDFSNNGDFHVKGAANLDWGMKDRLSRIFRPDTKKTVMLAFDHGYFMGPTSGLERLDLLIPRLADYADCLMGTRGAIRTSVPASYNKSVALRVSSGSSILQDDLSKESLVVSMEDAIKMNASALAVQTFVGADGQKETIEALNQAVNLGSRYSIPTMGVVAVGKEMERTTRFFLLATRMLAEFGAQIVKTYYCEDFEKVASATPVPLVVAGGKKVSEEDALTLAYKSIQSGAAGVDMGRNIFQSDNPEAMIQAVNRVVHEGMSDKQAYEFYLHLSNLTKETV
ncbi:3-hydroxy-5-phosphonooxypentane-2,4-dione thiolase [Virgibacillus halodenitrificans]|uniref:3-hydroxy-5-phosphonooxypentane-2,4-dione thiolase n=1 Tax=Virgibacillus halodenitrificans TaxID=1482 RepID=UPI002DBD4D0D|nr:3-hydroxy-5-phosphonooxypentane-2,4-dione thiolase [Virgibacillus halodenitrificans]MEC2159570.1 3-hydroxy-5-phosphonooxypentane-2,4-dione thiolase [Virgibacillus halodenitrificans]